MFVLERESDLKPLVAAVVAEVLSQREADEAKLNGRLGFKEAEAASLIGVERYVLRDARLRGEIKGRKVGKSIVYSRQELLRFLGEGSK